MMCLHILLGLQELGNIWIGNQLISSHVFDFYQENSGLHFSSGEAETNHEGDTSPHPCARVDSIGQFLPHMPCLNSLPRIHSDSFLPLGLRVDLFYDISGCYLHS